MQLEIINSDISVHVQHCSAFAFLLLINIIIVYNKYVHDVMTFWVAFDHIYHLILSYNNTYEILMTAGSINV